MGMKKGLRWLAEQRWMSGYATGLFGQFVWLFLGGREMQRMCKEYWGWEPSLALMLIFGTIGLWIAGRIVWWLRLQMYAYEKGWRAMNGKE